MPIHYKGYPFSKTTYYRRKKKAAELGCDIMDVRDTRGRHGNHASGDAHYRWNDGRMLSQEGYVKIRVGRSHPLADPNGYAYEHLLVWIAAGDTLGDGDVLHHLNGNRQDNEWGNLQRMTRAEHNALHNEGRKRDTGGRFV